MLGLLGYMAGGMAKGMGDAMVQEGLKKREAALKMLDYSLNLDREERSRAFTASENEKTRQANAESRSEYLTAEDGTLTRVYGDKATPVMGADDKPFKGRVKSANPTDFDKKMEIGAKLYPDDPEKAANWAAGNGGTTPSQRARLINEVAADLKPAFGQESEEQALARRTKASQIVDEMLGTSTQPAAAPAKKEDSSTVKSIQQQYPDAKQAPDGNWYVQKDNKWYRVKAGE